MFGTMEHLKREHPDMGLPKPKPVFTVDDYLRIDRTGQERYVFLDGEIYDMAGESGEHGDISSNECYHTTVIRCSNSRPGTQFRTVTIGKSTCN